MGANDFSCVIITSLITSFVLFGGLVFDLFAMQYAVKFCRGPILTIHVLTSNGQKSPPLFLDMFLMETTMKPILPCSSKSLMLTFVLRALLNTNEEEKGTEHAVVKAATCNTIHRKTRKMEECRLAPPMLLATLLKHVWCVRLFLYGPYLHLSPLAIPCSN